jgi:hypothetical protein
MKQNSFDHLYADKGEKEWGGGGAVFLKRNTKLYAEITNS